MALGFRRHVPFVPWCLEAGHRSGSRAGGLVWNTLTASDRHLSCRRPAGALATAGRKDLGWPFVGFACLGFRLSIWGYFVDNNNSFRLSNAPHLPGTVVFAYALLTPSSVLELGGLIPVAAASRKGKWMSRDVYLSQDGVPGND